MNRPTPMVWLHDRLLPVSQARVSVEDRGFLYGDGFFETLRAEDGRVQLLALHLERLAASAQAFRLPFPHRFPWEERLSELLIANGLSRGSAALKILLTRGVQAALGLPATATPTLLITARRYEPPPASEYAAGWPVVTFPEPRSTFLGRHKSLNYLFYLAARQHALDQGAREALILETDGRVSEGAATTLVVARSGGFFTPAAASALPGVTVTALAQGLAQRQGELLWAPLWPTDLREAQGVWLANSLLGLMPVASLDGRPLPVSSEATRFLSRCLAEAGGPG